MPLIKYMFMTYKYYSCFGLDMTGNMRGSVICICCEVDVKIKNGEYEVTMMWVR